VKRLDLMDLPRFCPLLTPSAGQYLADAAGVCLAEQRHGQDVIFQVTGEFRGSYLLQWPDITEQMRATYDREEATEYGACGLAILVMCDQTGLTVQRAFKGGGFDYWLGTVDEDRPFQNLARLEVSGIRHGNRRQIAARVKEKSEQVRRFDGTLPAYVVVVEFSAPAARVEKQ
jgi:hypothetical protein